MFLVRFPVEAFGTNCHVLARAEGGDAVVVDPGIGVGPQLREVLTRHGLTPAAVVLTHGHLDHVYGLDAVPEDVPVYVHEADAYRLVDPVQQIGPQLAAMLGDSLPSWNAPATSRLRPLPDGETVTVAGLDMTVAHAPGHTEGSVLLTLPGLPDQLAGTPDLDRTMLTGDVLFAGSIGRTDLVGGDGAVMERTLRDVVLAQPDTALVFPGHGPASTIGRERVTNPYLAL